MDSVQTNQEKPKGDYLSRSIKAAQILLLLSLQTQEENAENVRPLKHILVLTSNPSALGQDICGEDNIQVHVICPHPVVLGIRHHIYNNGWLLQNRESGPTECKNEEFGRAVDALIAHARSGLPSTPLTNVKVTISPSKACSLRGLYGATRFIQLHLGEVATVLIKAKTHVQKDGQGGLTGFPRGLRTPSGLVDLERELEVMLSESTEPTLSILVTYTHPALPEQTTCELTKEVVLPGSSSKSLKHTGTQSAFDIDPQVQCRQIYHVATQKSPKSALAVLRTHLGVNGSSSICQDYFRAVTDELKYQARVRERFDLANDVNDFNPRTSHIWGSASSRSVATSSTATTARRIPVKSTSPLIAHSRLPASPTRPAPLRVATRAPSNETIDHARRIWIELRRKTKGNIRPNDDSPEQEGRSKYIREVAAHNRRNIGDDTLKSMAYQARKENAAPWL